MGYGLGASIGAKMGCKDKTVFNIAGDGCFRMNMNEIATATRYNIPKMCIRDRPLVENAFYHGLEKRREPGGMLLIDGKRDQDGLVFTVSDNGGRLDRETLERLQETLRNPKMLEQEKRERKRIGTVSYTHLDVYKRQG